MQSSASPGAAALPRPSTSFVGRATELERLLETLQEPSCRLVTLHGPGGIGKTRLAIEAASRRAEETDVAFVSLEAATDPSMLPAAIASGLGVPLRFATDPEERLVASLAERETLLVLDNFEDVAEAAPFLAHLLDRCPGLRLLVTSRVVLGLREEWLLEVRGLDTAAHAAQTEAAQLFSERVRQSGVAPAALDRAAVARICSVLEGSPLAIELAAGWARALPLPVIADEIERDISFLETSLQNMPDRHRSVRAVFERTWERLAASEQLALGRLAVFCGDFDVEAAAAVGQASAVTLASFVDRSLVQRSRDGRYRVHAVLRQGAYRHLASDADALAAAREAHARYFVHRLTAFLPDLQSARQVEACAQIEASLPDFSAAWRHAFEVSAGDWLVPGMQAMQLFSEYRARYLHSAGLMDSVIERLEREGAPTQSKRLLATARVSRAWQYIRVGRLAEAETDAQRAAELYLEAGTAHAAGLGSDPRAPLGVAALASGRYHEALQFGRLATESAAAHRDPPGEAIGLYIQANAHSALGDTGPAVALLENALAISHRSGDRWFPAYLESELGAIAMREGRHTDAAVHFQAAFELRESFSDPQGMAVALQGLAQLALHEGDIAGAENRLAQALVHFREASDRGGVATVEGLFGVAAARRGDGDAARRRFSTALEAALDMGYAPLMFELLVSLAEAGVVPASATGDDLLAFVARHPDAPEAIRSRALGSSARVDSSGIQASPSGAGKTALEGVVAGALAALKAAALPPGTVPGMVEQLSARELEILRLVAGGATNVEIANRLVLSAGTVKWYTSQVFGKLGVRNRAEAAAVAVDAGFIG